MAKTKVVKAKPIPAALTEFTEIIEQRYNTAKKIYDYQDAITQEAIDAVADRLAFSSTGVIKLSGRPHELPKELVQKNTFFLAAEVVKDLAIYDIQVANFKFHPDFCASCNTRIKKEKVRRKLKRPVNKVFN